MVAHSASCIVYFIWLRVPRGCCIHVFGVGGGGAAEGRAVLTIACTDARPLYFPVAVWARALWNGGTDLRDEELKLLL